jgi:hypothetical protein
MTRLLDILFSGLAILVLSPILLLVALALRFSGEGEVLYLQERVGLRGKPFKLWKFATMLKNSPNMGTGVFTVKDDPRVLPAGRFLRRTKINELPQLVNIFKGDMSVVGPRPQTRRCFEAFPERLQEVISSMRPGLSELLLGDLRHGVGGAFTQVSDRLEGFPRPAGASACLEGRSQSPFGRLTAHGCREAASVRLGDVTTHWLDSAGVSVYYAHLSKSTKSSSAARRVGIELGLRVIRVEKTVGELSRRLDPFVDPEALVLQA